MSTNPEINTILSADRHLRELVLSTLQDGEQIKFLWDCHRSFFLTPTGIFVIWGAVLAALGTYDVCEHSHLTLFQTLAKLPSSQLFGVMISFAIAVLAVWLLMNQRRILMVTNKSILYFWLPAITHWPIPRTLPVDRINLQDITSVKVVNWLLGTVEFRSTGRIKRLLISQLSDSKEVVAQISELL